MIKAISRSVVSHGDIPFHERFLVNRTSALQTLGRRLKYVIQRVHGMPAPVVETVRFDRLVVPAGSSFPIGLSGSNLTPEMFFDVRFISPESNEPAVRLELAKRTRS
jgi:hypothetical protein